MVDVVQHLPGQLDIVVGELADFCVVDAEDLRVFGGSDLQAGDHVEYEEDQAGPHKGVGAPADRIGQLVSQLYPVVVQPASVDDLGIVEMSNPIGGEEAGAEISHETANTVDCEDIQGVVDSESEFELRGVVGEPSSKYAIGDGGPGRNIPFLQEIRHGHTQKRSNMQLNSPEPGVIETRPATTPEQNPTVDHLRSNL